MIQQHMRPTYHPSGKVRPITPSALVGLEVFAHRIPPEAELQPDLDVGTALSVELLSTTEVVVREASLAAGWLLGLAADSLHRGSGCADLSSDRSSRHAGGLQIEYLLLLRRADRTADRLADTTDRRSLSRLCRRCYARCARLRSYLTRDEALTEDEQG